METADPALVSLIYEATLDSALWQPVLAQITERLGGIGGTLLFSDDPTAPAIFAAHGFDETVLRRYNEHYVSTDFRLERLRRATVGMVATHTTLLITDRECERSEFSNDFLGPLDVFYAIGGALLNTEHGWANLSIHRARRHGEFSADDVSFLQPLLPHFRRAIELHRRLSAAEQMSRGVADLIDRLPIAVLAVNGAGAVLMANAAADEVLRARDGIARFAPGLRLDDREADAALRRIVRDACRGGVCTEQALQVRRPSMKAPWSVLVTPMPTRPGAALLMIETDAPKEIDAGCLQSLYALSPAEARLTSLLALGNSLLDVAKTLQISVHTARNQLKAVFAKMDVHTQAELVRRVLGGPALLSSER